MIDWIGQKLGNYRLTRVLGEGGFATVYLGEHIYLQTPAAIKVLQIHLTTDALERFLAEARIVARLTHPHIVPVLEFGIEGNTPFLVTGYAPFGSLRQHHPAGSMLAISTVVPYVMQIAAALQYAHDRNVIHRDVKPENLLLGQDQVLMLADFGIATSIMDVQQTIQRQRDRDGTAGTITYMAPEQFDGLSSAASDQYSLGVVVYEWLAGEPPFQGSAMKVALQHFQEPPPSLRSKVPAVSPEIEQVVMRALAKRPEVRFASIQAFAHALAAAAEAAPQSTQLRPPTKPLVLPGTSPADQGETTAMYNTQKRVAATVVSDAPMTPVQSPTRTARVATSTQSLRASSSPPLLPTYYKQPRPPLSRRRMIALLGAAGVAAAGLAALGAEAIWYNLAQPGPATGNHARPTPSPTPAATPTTPTAEPTPTDTPDATATAQAVTTQTIINGAATRATLISTVSGHMDMFVRGSDNALWQRSFDGVWHDWIPVLQGLAYDPVVASSGSGRFDLLVRGSDNSLQYTYYDGTWHDWSSQGGVITTDPSVASWGPGRFDVFARGNDNALWHKAYDGSWHDWEPLGGSLASAPAVAAWSANRLDVFVRGPQNDLGHIWYDGNWQPWESLGGSFTLDPTVISQGSGLLDIFVRNGDGSLYHKAFDGSWHDWEPLGGMLATSPSAVSWGPGHMDVYARGADNTFQHKLFSGVWHDWEPLQ